MTVRCRAPCEWRTYGKYRGTKYGDKVLNKQFKPEGTCILSVSSGLVIVDKHGKCTHFEHWDKTTVSYTPS